MRVAFYKYFFWFVKIYTNGSFLDSWVNIYFMKNIYLQKIQKTKEAIESLKKQKRETILKLDNEILSKEKDIVQFKEIISKK